MNPQEFPKLTWAFLILKLATVLDSSYLEQHVIKPPQVLVGSLCEVGCESFYDINELLLSYFLLFSGDSFTVCMEGITAFIDGPLAFLATYAFLSNKPYRYVVQLILSLFQLYGDVLYYATAAKEGFRHGPLWHPLHFWFYFVFLNAFWIVIPFICIVESYVNLSSAQSVVDKKEPSTNGNSKKK